MKSVRKSGKTESNKHLYLEGSRRMKILHNEVLRQINWLSFLQFNITIIQTVINSFDLHKKKGKIRNYRVISQTYKRIQ